MMDRQIAAQRLTNYLMVPTTPLDSIPQLATLFVFGDGDVRVPLRAREVYHERLCGWVVVSGGASFLGGRLRTSAEDCAHELRRPKSQDRKTKRIPEQALIVNATKCQNLSDIAYVGLENFAQKRSQMFNAVVVASPLRLKRAVAVMQKFCPGVGVFGVTFESHGSEMTQDQWLTQCLHEISCLEKDSWECKVNITVPDDIFEIATRFNDL